MSDRLINKVIKATICDFCDEEIDKTVDGYCYTDIKKSDVHAAEAPGYIRSKYNPVHYVFSWMRRGKKFTAPDAWVRYDFHADCFDKLMTKFLEEKL